MQISDVLDQMEVLDNELSAGSSEADEARAITALVMTQRSFEALVATLPLVLRTSNTVPTAANTERTDWPSTLLRLDSIWMVDGATSLPTYELDPIHEVGGHIGASPPWPLLASYGQAGRPIKYWADEAYFYWAPLPDAVYTLRTYGFYSRDVPTTRSSTFNFPNHLAFPFATMATRILSLGVGDSTDEYQALAAEIFGPSLKALRKKIRNQPTPRYYSRVHVV